MSTVLFRRPARRNGPEMPSGEISLQEPPTLPDPQRNVMRQMMNFLPAMLLSGVITLTVVGGRGPLAWLVSGLTIVAMAGMIIGQMAFGGGDRKRRLTDDRRDYLRYLAQHRRKARKFVAAQQAASAWRHPAPAGLWSVAMTTRRWERRPAHPDFLELRAGTGQQRMAVPISPLQTKPIEDLEPISAKSLRRFIRAYTSISDQPVAMFLPGFAQIHVTGDADTVRAFVRAVLGQVVALHAPEEVQVALCVDAEGRQAWEWAKWLPHAQHSTEQDSAGARRLVADSIEALETLLGEAFTARPRYEPDVTASRDEPYVVIVRDGGRMPAAARAATSGYRNAVLVDLAASPGPANKATLLLEVTRDELAMVSHDRLGQQVRTRLATPDLLGVAAAGALARVLSPYRLGGGMSEMSGEPMSMDFDLSSLLGIADVREIDLEASWAPRATADRLRVPIGIDASGLPVELDLKESALGGMGPHGILIGATGSGKSELLRTLVLALAVTHSSETLNFILVDFKGGATFLGLDQLPHTSAVITNLADEAALVGRMRDAINGELVRRQELLRKSGGYTSVLEYERARTQGAPLDPLPTLFIVVDEFSELLAAHRDFMDLFVMIGRLGRSLAVHLLLASQRVDDGRIGQLESHLSYRIGLRTFSAMESRSVIGVPDAYELPPSPGNGYLRTDVSTLVRFKAAYVSGVYRAKVVRVAQEVVQRQVVPYVLDYLPHRDQDLEEEPRDASPEPPAEDAPRISVMNVVLEQLVDKGPPAHQVWLPPLGTPPTLDHLLPALAPHPERGLSASGWVGTGRLVAPVGFIDKPFEQARDLLTVDLSGVGGHVGIAGGPQSGKSTLLRTLICSLALTHSPTQVQFYCLDFGGGTLASIAGLPHVGSVAGRLDIDRVNRTVAEMTSLIASRERRFAALGIDGMASYRQLRASGAVIDDPYGDVFLVIDGWFTLRREFEAAETAIRQITMRGLNFGVHLLMTTSRWSEAHHGMRDQIGTRLELRLGDSVDSAIDLRLAATVPQLPGRGLTMDKLHFLAGLPRIDGDCDPATLTEGVRELAAMSSEFWDGPRAPQVRTLPDQLPAQALPAPEGDVRIAIGLEEEGMQPVWHNFSDVAHLTVLGDVESGKSNLLRLVANGVMSRYTPAEARILIVDYRRQLFDSVPPPYRLGYSVSRESTTETVADAVAGLRQRVPGADITPEQLRRRDWWTGPRLFVLVDDYDLLAGAESPLQPLMQFLPHGADIGFHVVLTRAAVNVMRMSMDPMLRRLQETNSPDIALSCPPSEGPLMGGTKPRHLPAGRALLCTRRGSRLIQTAWCEPVVSAAPDGDALG
ncbi:type VII secretion protein EccCa [Catellatospora citrea]|uniref:Type VII secretion protein EccC n=1 Tax=Catellatospora citrea TaxID=53366 RepID=A0A8J3KH48_9ACTN|nr:type VII secretion protein EccCa [Catellatospora citrea]RKE10660.1 S-DNA-T family DNA segregation ATPase FtsK/SpoIIIE [Catellatospora citrea]GIG03087.1 type VII secretion protein EccC [Catellatospora citrea]